MNRINQKIGKFGETLAQNYLINKGYKIINTNIQIHHKEIDILASIKDYLVFIEVKTRTNDLYGSADEALNNKKMKLLRNAINIYVEKNKIDANFVRLDLLAIDINKPNKIAKIKHYRDIF